MFACRNLNLSYKGNKILKDIHFHIPEGTVFCITGESGSGKSSLLKVINGIIPEITEAEISGEIKLNDMRLNEMDIAQRSRYISTVYQNPKTQFYCVESTDELAFPLENRNLPKDEMVKIIKKYTELLDTEKLLNRNIFSLSGGEKQLMAITSVMTMDNQVYLFDEPSASLDHHSIGLLKKCIAELKRKGKIVIIAEHRLYYLKEIMDYLAVLKEGKLEMISVEDLDHDKICRLKETYALRSFEEIRKEELLSDNPCYQIQMLNKTKNGEKDKNILKCKNFAQSFKNTKIMDIGEIGFSEGIYFIIGENGVGKSTFIKKMAKLLKGKGKSFYCGNEIKRSYEYISMVMQDVNHQVSKALVENNPKHTLFVLEDLSGIRNATERVKTKDRYVSVSWSFYDLEQKLIYKAKQNQSSVIKVDPRYTSQCCPCCGHIEKANRNKKMHLFTCKNCGYKSNDDRIGAMNLYRMGIDYLVDSQVPNTVVTE